MLHSEYMNSEYKHYLLNFSKNVSDRAKEL